MRDNWVKNTTGSHRKANSTLGGHDNDGTTQDPGTRGLSQEMIRKNQNLSSNTNQYDLYYQ